MTGVENMSTETPMNKGNCILIGAGDLTISEIPIQENDLCIAVDAGYEYCKLLEIEPDYILGDFDSLSEKEVENVAQIAKAEEDKAQRIIEELFEHYMQLLKIYSANYDELKAQQTVCDYISGMTDRYIVQKYTQNFIPRSMARVDDDGFLFRFAKLNGLNNVND